MAKIKELPLFCPLTTEKCRLDCTLLTPEDSPDGTTSGQCSVYSAMVSLNRIAVLLELIRVERG